MIIQKTIKQLFAEQFWRDLQAAHKSAEKTTYDKVAFQNGIVYVMWVGTHADYDKRNKSR